MSDEKVSVIMPTYNRGYKISKSIESVINQIYSNWELIVVDDYSTDNTREIIHDISQKDSRIKYLLNGNKKGVSGARNFGIQNSNGTYIAFLDSDDTWYDYHLNQSIRILEKEGLFVAFSLWDYKNSSKVYSLRETENFDIKLASALEKNNARELKDYYIFSNKFFLYSFHSEFYCTQINTLVIKKEAIFEIGLFNEDLMLSEDDDLTTRIYKRFSFCLLKRSSFIYSVGGDDSLYGYVDRNELLTVIKNEDYPKDFISQDLLKKLKLKCLNDIKLVSLKANYLMNSLSLTESKKILSNLYEQLAYNCFTVGYIHRRDNKLQALRFYIKSLVYKKSITTIIYISKLLIPQIKYKQKNLPLVLW